MITVTNPLKRIDLYKSPEQLIKSVLKEFDLGSLKNHKVMMKGVIEINFRVTTSRGIYVVKIFSNKRLPRVKDILFAQQTFYKNRIPFPKVYFSKKGEPYFTVHSKKGKPYYGCIIEWFEGEDFTDSKPTPKELRAIAKYIAMINTTRVRFKPIYDECFPINLPAEYKKRKRLLNQAQGMI